MAKTQQKQSSQQQQPQQTNDVEQDAQSLLGNAALAAQLGPEQEDDGSSLLMSEESGLDLGDELDEDQGMPDWARLDTIEEEDLGADVGPQSESNELEVDDADEEVLGQPTMGKMDELMEHAEDSRPLFDEALQQIAADTDASTDSRKVRERHKHDPKLSAKKNAAKADEVYRLGKLDPETEKRNKYRDQDYTGTAKGVKKEARVQEKADQKYDGDITRVLDLVRGTVAYGSMDELHKALQTVWNGQKTYGFEIVRCKQTYQVGGGKDATLYGDVKFNIKLDETEHICELQFQHTKMIDAKDHAHAHYEDMRQVESRKLKGQAQLGDDKVQKQALKGNHMAYEWAHRQIAREDGYDTVVSDVEALSSFLASGDASKLPAGFQDVFEVAPQG